MTLCLANRSNMNCAGRRWTGARVIDAGERA
jgi:hypothetical protein